MKTTFTGRAPTRSPALIHATLAALLLMLPQLSLADIFKCRDISSGSMVFSSQRCDTATQEQLGVLSSETLEQRQSTFDGASLRQKHQAQERKRAAVRAAMDAQTKDGTAPATDVPGADAARTSTSDNESAEQSPHYCRGLQREKDTIMGRLSRPHNDAIANFFQKRLQTLAEKLNSERCSNGVFQASEQDNF